MIKIAIITDFMLIRDGSLNLGNYLAMFHQYDEFDSLIVYKVDNVIDSGRLIEVY